MGLGVGVARPGMGARATRLGGASIGDDTWAVAGADVATTLGPTVGALRLCPANWPLTSRFHEASGGWDGPGRKQDS